MLSSKNFLKEFDSVNHVMVDIETLSTENNAVIVQISAVQFNPYTGKNLNTFNANISIQSALDFGLNINESTLRFWLEQEKSAIDMVFTKNTVSLPEALLSFSNFIKSCSTSIEECNTRIWGNGPSFDAAKLKSAYSATQLQLPWIYWNERCVRTIVACDYSYKKNETFEGIKHYGIDDCKHQIKYISKGLQALVAPEAVIDLLVTSISTPVPSEFLQSSSSTAGIIGQPHFTKND